MATATAVPVTMRDLITDALADAYYTLVEDCPACSKSATGVCSPDHEDDRARADRYDTLRRRIAAADPVVFEGLLAAALRGTEET